MRLALATLIVGLLAPMAAAEDKTVQYWAVFSQDEKTGYRRVERTVEGDRVTITVYNQSAPADPSDGLAMRRAPGRSPDGTTYVTTLSGDLLRITDMDRGPESTWISHGVVEAGQIYVQRGVTGSAPTIETLPYAAETLTPEAIRLLLLAHMATPKTRFRYREFTDPESPGVRRRVVVGEQTPVMLIGRNAELTKLRITTASTISAQVESAYVDQNGWILRSSGPSFLGWKETIACSKQFAASPNGRIDLAKGGSVAPPSPIANPRGTRQGTFKLAPTDESTALVPPTTDSQTVTKHADGTVTVRVKVLSGPTGTFPYRGEDAEPRLMLAITPFIETRNRYVRKQARESTAGVTDALAAAEKIAQWVGGYIKDKTPTVGYDSAFTAMENTTGDCTEHALLTAALCRAAGIPCRVVTGMVYVEKFGPWKQRFIGHMWNEVYVDGTWAGIDSYYGIDACRIALATGEGYPGDFAAVIHSLNNITMAGAAAK